MPRKATTPAQETADDIRRATSIEPVAIREEYAALPSDIARWGQVYAQACDDESRAKLELKAWLGQEIGEAQGADEAEGRRPRGADALKEVLVGRKEYRQRAEAAIAATRVKQDAEAVVEALKAKKDMLVSLGAHLRLDEERDIVINRRDRRGT